MDSKAKGELGEAFVNRIAYSSFLKYWCFPNPLDITKDNKEICDLLIVFGEICVIISVKNYSFGGKYQPYFKKTIDKALRQISGAERRLFGDRDILLKHPDREVEVFRAEKIKKTIRIIVNTNTEVKFYQTVYFDKNQNQVSVFDAHAWEEMLTELNTIPDFTKYLDEREKVFRGRPAIILPRDEFDFSHSAGEQLTAMTIKLHEEFPGIAIISGSEKDLVWTYIVNGYKFPDDFYNGIEPSLLLNVDGTWRAYLSTDFIEQKKQYEQDSYFIDDLVQKLILSKEYGGHISKMLYSLDRWERSELVKLFFKFHEDQLAKDPPVQLHRTNVEFHDHHYIFVYFNGSLGDLPQEVVVGFVQQSINHHSYLKNYECGEIAAIGFSYDLTSFVCGYTNKDIGMDDSERAAFPEFVKAMGWKLR